MKNVIVNTVTAVVVLAVAAVVLSPLLWIAVRALRWAIS